MPAITAPFLEFHGFACGIPSLACAQLTLACTAAWRHYPQESITPGARFASVCPLRSLGYLPEKNQGEIGTYNLNLRSRKPLPVS